MRRYFVTEKKSVVSKESAVLKVSESYRSVITPGKKNYKLTVPYKDLGIGFRSIISFANEKQKLKQLTLDNEHWQHQHQVYIQSDLSITIYFRNKFYVSSIEICIGFDISEQVESHVNLLAELVPDWLTVSKARSKYYLKIDKSRDIILVCEKLNKILKEKR